jgi:hypothetical protein
MLIFLGGALGAFRLSKEGAVRRTWIWQQRREDALSTVAKMHNIFFQETSCNQWGSIGGEGDLYGCC